MTFEKTSAQAQRVVVALTHANNGNRLDAIALVVTCHASIVLLFEIRVTGEAERAGRWARLDRAGSHVGPSAVKWKCDLACSGENPREQVCTRSRDRLPIFLQKSVSLAYLHSKGIKRERERSGFKERSVSALGGSYMHKHAPLIAAAYCILPYLSSWEQDETREARQTRVDDIRIEIVITVCS